MEAWKSKIGLIYLSSSTVMEREWSLMTDGSFSYHVARISLPEGMASKEAIYEMVKSSQLEIASEQLSEANVDLICFGCTIGSLIGGNNWDKKIINRIEKVSGVQATTTSTEILKALEACNAKVVSIATPYLDELNQLEKEFLEIHGFKVAVIKGLGLRTDKEIAQQDPDIVVNLAKEAFSPMANCLFLSCTNLRTIEIIELLEKKYDIPVLSSVQASLWGSLRQLDIRYSPSDEVGSLFTKF